MYVYGYIKLELGDICNISTGKLNANKAVSGGKYPFFTCSENPKEINSFSFDTNAIIISGNGSKLGHINKYNGKFDAYQRTYVLYDFKIIYIESLYHYLKKNLKNYICVNMKKASVPYITLSVLKKFPIYIYSYEQQIEISNILDKFDEYINDINKGLPYEIELRKKQYEYYRNKLLTFEKEN